MKKSQTIHMSGKRKTAVARANITQGTGKFLINKKDAKVYFSSKLYQDKVLEPLYVLGIDNFQKYDISVNVNGGGINGQTEAIKVAVSNAIAEISQEYKNTILKYDRSFLVPDTRVKETNKPNRSKARAKRQKSYR